MFFAQSIWLKTHIMWIIPNVDRNPIIRVQIYYTLSPCDLVKKQFARTMTKALEAAVRFIPTPPAFSDINNT